MAVVMIVVMVIVMVMIVGMLMVVATGNMIVVDVHKKFLLAGFSIL